MKPLLPSLLCLLFACAHPIPTQPSPRPTKPTPFSADIDGDLLPNTYDECPNKPEDFDLYEDDDGCPELDNDKDAVADADDKCPNDPEDLDSFEDDDGCPEKNNRVVLVPVLMWVEVGFDDNSLTVRPHDLEGLHEIALLMLEYPRVIALQGYAKPSEKKPAKLALARMNAVRDYLISLGIPAVDIEVSEEKVFVMEDRTAVGFTVCLPLQRAPSPPTP